MAWFPVQESDMNGRITTAEINAVRTLFSRPGAPDPVTDEIARAINEARGYAGASGKYLLGPDQTISEKLHDAVIAITVYRLALRFPTKVLASDERKKLHDDALLLLRQCAQGHFALEVPAVESSEQLSQMRPSFIGRHRRFTLRQEDGV